MTIHKYIIILTLALASFTGYSQTIWPGDINNNGIVNGVDLLYWGQAYGSSGPARAETSAEWAPVQAPAPWGSNFENGLNFSYADCNGDGIVDEEDLDEGIEENYGRLRDMVMGDNFANARPGDGPAPRIQLTADRQVVRPGEQVNISLRIDDSSRPVQQFYGLALKMSYDTTYLEGDDGLDFDLNENSWLNADGSYVESLYQEEGENRGAAMLAVTRTNQQFVPVGDQEIGSLSVVIEDIIISKEIDTIQIIIDSVLMITDGFRSIATEPTTFQLFVTENPDSVITSHEQIYNPLNYIDEVKAFPNPARHSFFVEAPVPIERVDIFNAIGQRVAFQIQESGKQLYQVRLQKNLPPGLLFVRLHLEGQAITRRLLYQSN